MFYNYNISSNWCDSLNLRLRCSEVSFRTTWEDLRKLIWISFLVVCSFVEWNLALYYTQQWMIQLCSLQLCLQVMLWRQQPGETRCIVHLHSWDDTLFVIKYLIKSCVAILITLWNVPPSRKKICWEECLRSGLEPVKTLHNGSGLQYHALTRLPLQCLCCVSPTD